MKTDTKNDISIALLKSFFIKDEKLFDSVLELYNCDKLEFYNSSITNVSFDLLKRQIADYCFEYYEVYISDNEKKYSIFREKLIELVSSYYTKKKPESTQINQYSPIQKSNKLIQNDPESVFDQKDFLEITQRVFFKVIFANDPLVLFLCEELFKCEFASNSTVLLYGEKYSYRKSYDIIINYLDSLDHLKYKKQKAFTARRDYKFNLLKEKLCLQILAIESTLIGVMVENIDDAIAKYPQLKLTLAKVADFKQDLYSQKIKELDKLQLSIGQIDNEIKQLRKISQ
jgi:hypothetical protein